MMNITILSLITSSIYSNSPAFIGKNISLANCNFHKVFPLIFYNQKGLNVKDTAFTKVIGGIILNSVNDPIIEGNHWTYSYTYTSQFDKSQISTETNVAITFYGCLFLEVGNYGDTNPLLIEGDSKNITIYITRSTFVNCKSKEGEVILKSCRCITITHLCSFNSQSNGRYGFCNINCRPNDFFIFIYSTIVTDDNYGGNAQDNILCQSGDQYFRCINMTNFYKRDNGVALNFDDSQCFSFAFANIINCKGCNIELSGKNDNSTGYILQNINIMSDSSQSLIRMTSDNVFNCTIYDSVLLNKNKGLFSSDKNHLYLNIVNCIYHVGSDNQGLDHVIISNSESTDSYSSNLIQPHQMFVNDSYCEGPTPKPDEVVTGCNSGDCINEKCPRTIGFPQGVPTYPQIIDTDLQTDFFTPSKTFKPTNPFTKSNTFTSSKTFTPSGYFTASIHFTETNLFTGSFSFTGSSSFSDSHLFTKSTPFSHSHSFSSSYYFTDSKSFTSSHNFTKSQFFTSSHLFTGSHNFTWSNAFTSSLKFSKSGIFTESKHFSSSFYFTKTGEFSETGKFSETNDFTESGLFSKSSYFTQSHPFTPTLGFNASHTFTPSNSFSASDPFKATFYFTYSSLFSSSRPFSVSSLFSDTDKFSETIQFTFSSDFTESNEFTFSGLFSNSKGFTKSSPFSVSEAFTPSKHFDATSTFTPSNVFSRSEPFNASSQFTHSSFFSKTTEFSLSKKFSSSSEFTPSNHFDATGTFTASSKFTASDHFTSSGTFTSSEGFTKSFTFSMSYVFTLSKSFTQSNTYQKIVEININQSKNKNKWKVLGGVIAAVACAVLIAAILIAFIIIRHRKHEESSDMFEELNAVDDRTTSITYNNVLHGIDMEDDPFHDDFHDNDYHHFD